VVEQMKSIKLSLWDWVLFLVTSAAVGLLAGVVGRVFGISVPGGVIGALAALAAITVLRLRGSWSF